MQKAREGLVIDTEDFTGRFEAVKKIEVRAQVEGRLEKIYFTEGGRVKEGDVLFDIEPVPYQLDLNIAEEALEVAKAKYDRLLTEFQRAERLNATRSISPEDYLKAKGEYLEAKAGVAKADKEKARAKYHLDNTKVKAESAGAVNAPAVAGHAGDVLQRSQGGYFFVGRSYLDLGNLVQKNVTVLTTLVSDGPIYAYFDIDERSNLKLKRLKEKKGEDLKLKVLVSLADEDKFEHEGVVDFRDVMVDPATGTLRMRGVFSNDKGLFAPGMFVRVRLNVGAERKATTVPEQAVGTDQGQKFVFVVNDKNEVEYRKVETGALKDGRRVIEEGVQPGERVIVSGLQKVRAKATVVPREEPLPSLRATEPPSVRVGEKKD